MWFSGQLILHSRLYFNEVISINVNFFSFGTQLRCDFISEFCQNEDFSVSSFKTPNNLDRTTKLTVNIEQPIASQYENIA